MLRFVFCSFLITFLLIHCQPEVSSEENPAQALLHQFPSISLPDTLHVWREMPWEQFTPISDSILTAAVEDSLLEILSPYIEDADTIQAMGRFSLGETYDACMIKITYAWYVHIAWILFEKEKKVFTGARLLSGLDGGDGGQYLTESWLMDWESDGDLDQLWLSHEHTMRMGEDEPQVIDENGIALFLWENEEFRPEILADSTALMKRFAIDW